MNLLSTATSFPLSEVTVRLVTSDEVARWQAPLILNKNKRVGK